MKTRILLLTMALGLFWSSASFAQTAMQQSAQRLDASSTAVHTHTTGATLTITPPAGQYVYVTGLDISNCANGSAVTPAAPTYITTTNLNGAPQYQLASGVTAGVCQPTIAPVLTTPYKSTVAGTAVTFVVPAFATNQVVSVNVYYYTNNL